LFVKGPATTHRQSLNRDTARFQFTIRAPACTGWMPRAAKAVRMSSWLAAVHISTKMRTEPSGKAYTSPQRSTHNKKERSLLVLRRVNIDTSWQNCGIKVLTASRTVSGSKALGPEMLLVSMESVAAAKTDKNI
jgi:hypothetical protein